MWVHLSGLEETPLNNSNLKKNKLSNIALQNKITMHFIYIAQANTFKNTMLL